MGFTERYPTDDPADPEGLSPRLITSWTQFENLYGSFTPGAVLPLSVYGYFANGGSLAYVVRGTGTHSRSHHPPRSRSRRSRRSLSHHPPSSRSRRSRRSRPRIVIECVIGRFMRSRTNCGSRGARSRVPQAPPGRPAALVRQRAADELTRYIHPLTGGADGSGWLFDADLNAAAIAQLLETVAGVSRVDEVQLFEFDLRTGHRIGAGRDVILQTLAGWIGVDGVDASLPPQLQRLIVASSSRSLAHRGTVRGLREFVEMLSGAPADVIDGGGIWREGDAPRDVSWVRITVAGTGHLSEDEFVAILRDEVPAHVRIEVWVGPRRVLSTVEEDR